MGLHEHLRAALEDAGWPASGAFGPPRGAGPHGPHRHRFGPLDQEDFERRARRGGSGASGGRGRGFGPATGLREAHRQWQSGGPEQVSAGDVTGWLAGRLPDGWFSAAPQVTVDREEILIVGPLTAPDVPVSEPGATDEEKAAATAAAEAGRISRFREETRDERVRIAREAEHRYGRKVAWGARAGDTSELFTTMSIPVMTRLRQPERLVLDTLVDAGVARSRSDALAWCVRLVGQHTEDWLQQLRDAMTAVERVRAEGPQL